jgi:hypothetical protein
LDPEVYLDTLRWNSQIEYRFDSYLAFESSFLYKIFLREAKFLIIQNDPNYEISSRESERDDLKAQCLRRSDPETESKEEIMESFICMILMSSLVREFLILGL